MGGRWNPEGIEVVYTSSSLALAILETLVHTGTRVLPTELHAYRLELPTDAPIKETRLPELPATRRQYPSSPDLQQIGRTWIESGQTMVLAVPSAVVPTEANFLLNPAHPDFKRVKVLASHPLELDLRLSG